MIEQRSVAGCNRDYAWDDFNPVDYFKFNYVELRPDDRQIVEIVRDFFADTFSANPFRRRVHGIDVGTGANLYPALTMLPFCESVTLYEFSAANVTWLESQHAEGWPSWNEAWDQFWVHLRKRWAYRCLRRPRAKLSKRARIIQGDVFKLRDQDSRHGWDVGTMFFVAESITGQRKEFLDAVDRFFAVLKPDAPFAMAFMEHSKGYQVGAERYPATDIDEGDVSKCLRERARDVQIHHLGPGDKPLREKYSGMIIALGRVNHKE